jgi:hypothetical protein
MSREVKRLEGNSWVQVPATWGLYRGLLKARGERSAAKYVYRKGRLTIVSPSMEHERIKSRLTWMIEEMFLTLGIDFVPTGSLTLHSSPPSKHGVEGDASYYVCNLDLIRHKERVEMGIDPPPDLEVEVVISNPVRDALRVHAAFGVKEVWVCKPGVLTFVVLGDDRRYRPSVASLCLPQVGPDELAGWIFNEESRDELTPRRAFREWAATSLAPRHHPSEGAPEARP